MQTLKLKDKIKKKCKEFLAVTLISSSLMVSCAPKGDDNIYDTHNDFDFTSTTDKDTVDVDKDVPSDKEQIDDKDLLNDKDEISDNNIDDESDDSVVDIDVADNDLINDNDDIIDTETDEDIEIPDKDNQMPDDDVDTIPVTNTNTGTKYIVSSQDIKAEYNKECFDYVKLARLISVHCETPDKINLETPSGKCYVPYYMTGNAPKQATSSCAINIKLGGIEGSIKQGIHESNPEAFSNKVTLLIKNLMYLYLTHEYVLDENIRKIATYPYDGMNEQYTIPEYVNNFEFKGVPYKMLNEHLEVLHEMEFINTNNNVHTRFRLYPNNFKELGNYPFFVLDLLKCPELDNKELSLAVLGFLPNKNYENDTKYVKYLNGECDSIYEQRTQELINELEN